MLLAQRPDPPRTGAIIWAEMLEKGSGLEAALTDYHPALTALPPVLLPPSPLSGKVGEPLRKGQYAYEACICTVYAYNTTDVAEL